MKGVSILFFYSSFSLEKLLNNEFILSKHKQVDQKLLRNMRFSRKHNKSRQELLQLEAQLRQAKK